MVNPFNEKPSTPCVPLCTWICFERVARLPRRGKEDVMWDMQLEEGGMERDCAEQRSIIIKDSYNGGVYVYHAPF
jgi:hypothetical protein